MAPQELYAPAGFFFASKRGPPLERLGPSLGRVEHAQDLNRLASDAVRHDAGRGARKELARARYPARAADVRLGLEVGDVAEDGEHDPAGSALAVPRDVGAQRLEVGKGVF